MIGRYPVMVMVAVAIRIVALCIRITGANMHREHWIANYFYDFCPYQWLTNI